MSMIHTKTGTQILRPFRTMFSVENIIIIYVYTVQQCDLLKKFKIRINILHQSP
jgi:hypothetical protein